MDKFSQSKRDTEHDFESIESAVLETPRGRWFLAEYARRAHQSENEFLLLSIRRLENLLNRKASSPEAHDILMSCAKVLDIIESITRTIAIDHHDLNPADHPLRGISLEAEDIMTEISLAADMIRDLADVMKGKSSSGEQTEKIAAQASLIIDLGAKQSKILKRLNAIIEMQRIVEDNLSRLIESTLAVASVGNDNDSTPVV
ncbi:MAG: hypothetical protein ACKOC1_02945 [Hyphomicrobiales bacterium]